MDRAFEPSELRRRLRNVRNTTWYIPILAKGDVTQYDRIFKTRYIDVITQLMTLLRSSGG